MTGRAPEEQSAPRVNQDAAITTANGSTPDNDGRREGQRTVSALTPRGAGAIRPLELDDAEELATLYRANSEFLVPFVEIRDESFFTAEGQQQRIARAAATASAREGWRFAILDDGAIAGTIGVTNVVRGPLQSAKLGYWVAQAHGGRGLASRAVGEVATFALYGAGLHRLEAWTLVDNLASQRVLEKNDFNRFGLARGLLLVDGEWRDHILFERVADES